MTLPLRIELAMTLKVVFPDVLARHRTAGLQAISGGNILVLPPKACAADLKSRHLRLRIRPRDFKSRSGTRIIRLRVPMTFRSSRGVDPLRERELRKVDTRILGRSGAAE